MNRYRVMYLCGDWLVFDNATNPFRRSIVAYVDTRESAVALAFIYNKVKS